MGLVASFLGKILLKRRAPKSGFHGLLRAHFGVDPQSLPIVAESFDPNEHPNLHLAMESYLNQPGRSAELHGVAGEHAYPGVSLSGLVRPAEDNLFEVRSFSVGPIQYVNIAVDDDVLACVQVGLYLVRDGDERFAVLVRGPMDIGYRSKAQVEVLGRTKEAVENVLANLRSKMREKNVYRGRVLSFNRDEHGLNTRIGFERIPQIGREQIVLPEGILDRIDRHTLLFTRHSEKLRAAGRHLKRGLLFHGRPGAGKTLTAMYVASQMQGRTVFLVAGLDFGMLGPICRMARALQPAIVILEDVDLIAEDRARPGCVSPLLYELLNQMDGIAEDTDVVFLLTTNRAEVLEPALAARPGRVDQAVEFPLPDSACRRRLFELYGRGLQMELTELDRFIQRTDGASAAFIRELLRKSALLAADDSGADLVVRDRHVDEALRELLVSGGEMTRTLLGAETREARATTH